MLENIVTVRVRAFDEFVEVQLQERWRTGAFRDNRNKVQHCKSSLSTRVSGFTAPLPMLGLTQTACFKWGQEMRPPAAPALPTSLLCREGGVTNGSPYDEVSHWGRALVCPAAVRPGTYSQSMRGNRWQLGQTSNSGQVAITEVERGSVRSLEQSSWIISPKKRRVLQDRTRNVSVIP